MFTLLSFIVSHIIKQSVTMFPIPLSLLLVSLAKLSVSSPVQDEKQTEVTILTKLEALSSRMSMTEEETKDLRAENAKLNVKLREVLEIVSDQQGQIQQLKRALAVATKTPTDTKCEEHVLNSRLKQNQGNKKKEGRDRDFRKIPIFNYPITSVSRKNDTSKSWNDRNGNRSKERIVQRPRAPRLLLPASTEVPSPLASSRVAFSVHLNAHLYHLGVHHPIVFDVVDLAIGGGYDKILGVFICPVSGIYFFTGTIFSHPGDIINVEMVLDGVHIASMEAGATSNRYAQATNVAIRRCNKNQHVWLREWSSGSQLYGGGYSSFSGFLLWPDEN